MKFKILLSFLSIILTFSILEIGIRLYELKSSNIPLSQSICNYENNLFGWSGKMVADEFREGKKRVFIIGDSFTEGNGVEEDSIYYSVLKNNLDADFFVYAAGGYGTTQELLVMRNYINSVRPDLIIFQITSNDVINNDFNLEKRSYSNNNRMIRPYYVDGQFKNLYPSNLGLIRYFLECQSRFVYRFFNKIDSTTRWLAINEIIKSTESDLDEDIFFKDHVESLETTKQLIDQIISLSKGIPIIFLPANENESELCSLFKTHVDNESVYWLDQPTIVLSRIINTGENVLQKDGNHFNEVGHKYFGEILLKNLIEKSIVPKIIPII